MGLKKAFLFILLFSMQTSCAMRNPVSLIPQRAFVQIHTRVSILECHKNSKICKPKTWGSVGSGVIVKTDLDNSYVITAGHVCNVYITKPALLEIKSLKIEVSILSYDKKLHKSRIIHSNNLEKKEADLCLLQTRRLGHNGVKISRRGMRIGDRLYSMGAPAGIYHPPTVPILEGIYSGVMPDGKNFLSSIPAVGGSSGSPVFNSKMELVGILFAAHPRFDHISISTEFEPTRDFLRKHLK